MRLIALVGVLALVVAAPALARQAGGKQARQAAAQPARQQLEGKVSSVDLATNTLEIEPRPGLAAVRLHVTAETRFEGPGVKDLSSLREGEPVRASYVERDGRNMAQTVSLLEGRGGAAPEEAKGPAPAPPEEKAPLERPAPPSR